MPTIGLATFAENPNLYFDDEPLPAALQRRGYDTCVAAWNDMTVNWADCAAVVIRTAWDYHLKIAAFRVWLQQLESNGVTVINPPDLLRWNMDKSYLRDIANFGCRMLETVFVQQGQAANLADIITQQNWEQVVIKPLIGANALDTWLIHRDNAASQQAQFERVVQATGAMVQQFAPQIHNGEWSLVFFNSVFSHATLKFPAQGTIFVHEDKGGITRLQDAPLPLIAQASQVLRVTQRLSGVLPVYARVDGLVDGDDFVLMEIECIEPELFLTKAAPYAAERFADAILSRV